MSNAEEEDDYMSDKLLQSSDIRPGLLFNRGQKRIYEQYKKKVQQKKPKTHAEMEQERREIGLETPIASDNKGFQLLQKMGFQSGSKIGLRGATKSTLQEPIKIETKSNKTGVGHDKHIAETKIKTAQLRQRVGETIVNDFKKANIQKTNEKFLLLDYEKAQRICEELDTRNAVPEPIHLWYWSKREIIKEVISKTDSEEDSEVDEDVEEEEEVEVPPPIDIADVCSKLGVIIDYLRTAYCYCVYCAIKFENNEDMNQNCPGSSRQEHDDM